jgi:tRNA pseudouridine55 synthase
MGKALGVGAHLTALQRTRIGEFLLADALTMDDLVRLRHVQHN